MIQINWDHMDWKNMSDEERIILSDTLVLEFERLIVPLVNFLTISHEQDKLAAPVMHDFIRVKTNCKMFTHDAAEKNWIMIWKSCKMLYHINWFLEAVVNPGIQAKGLLERM